MDSKDFKKVIIDRLSAYLKTKQFKKKGNVFSLSNGDLTYYIGLQSSQSSNTDILKVTVNTEIASEMISKLDDSSLPLEHQRHYNRRIGSYLNNQQDKWWVVDSYDVAEEAADEIVSIIYEKVIPKFDQLKSTNDLASLWKNGGYIGITDRQRKNYLSLLENTDK
ncbi:MAG: DUF4304 domain-containing protein [Imperialibacter sp.]|uniref:DUF4304 domain-containing protein n=1 Tax=Imperialibacter sp. TaxID=2038411 RepID=UPI0032EE2E6A